LTSYRASNSEGATDWAISQGHPLKTVVSRGAYELGSGGHHSIFAQVTAKWRIRKAEQKARGQIQQFKLVGIASTRVQLICAASGENSEREIASWRMEIADGKSPGCFFHVQVLGQGTDFPFPSSLPIPRLPGFILTPAAVMEFVLAELFQESWAKHVVRNSTHLNRWIPIQQVRLSRLLKWKLSVLSSGGSPWTTLKQKRPEPTLFV
jgi:hypothetical protein